MPQINLKLRQIRRKRNMSQEELARRLGVSRQAVIAIEQGESLPSLPVLIALLEALNIPFHHLFQGDWAPFRQFQPDQDSVSSNLPSHYRPDYGRTMPVDISENDEAIFVAAEVPGVTEEDLAIDIGNQHLVISGIKKPTEQQNAIVYSQEITYGSVVRILSLPCPINPELAEAHFRNGMLLLRLPKLSPQIKRRIRFTKEENGSE